MKQRFLRFVRFTLLLLFVLLSTTYLLRYFSRSATTSSFALPPPSTSSGGANNQIMTSRNSADFFWFTDYETTRFNAYFWFFGGDSLYAPLSAIFHSNDNIYVHPGAYFGTLVTTHGRVLSPQGSTFMGVPRPGYIEHVLPYSHPTFAANLRDSARVYGTWLSGAGTYTHGLVLSHNTGYIWRWQSGTDSPFGDTSQIFQTIQWGNTPYAIFCDGTLWLKGSFHGKLGIGASGSIRLMDDVCYEDANQSNNWTVPLTSQNYLTLISEAPEINTQYSEPLTGIIIANTWENGRENGYGVAPADLTRHSIVITAQVMALNSSFQFEQENDMWDAYQTPGTVTDYRGFIRLRGNLIQHRHGYLHRSNHNGTGYTRDLKYDPRFQYVRPPFSITFTTP